MHEDRKAKVLHRQSMVRPCRPLRTRFGQRFQGWQFDTLLNLPLENLSSQWVLIYAWLPSCNLVAAKVSWQSLSLLPPHTICPEESRAEGPAFEDWGVLGEPKSILSLRHRPTTAEALPIRRREEFLNNIAYFVLQGSFCLRLDITIVVSDFFDQARLAYERTFTT